MIVAFFSAICLYPGLYSIQNDRECYGFNTELTQKDDQAEESLSDKLTALEFLGKICILPAKKLDDLLFKKEKAKLRINKFSKHVLAAPLNRVFNTAHFWRVFNTLFSIAPFSVIHYVVLIIAMVALTTKDFV